jgi:hypothetical protein
MIGTNRGLWKRAPAKPICQFPFDSPGTAADDIPLMRLQAAALESFLLAFTLQACRHADVAPDVRDLTTLLQARTARSSSWDRTGGNRDCEIVEPGEEKVLAQVRGAGSIRHIFIGTTTPAGAFLRELVLRAYWDGESSPSVEVPLGDFFLTPYEAYVRNVQTALVVVNPGRDGLGSHGYSAYFPMPFGSSARLTVTNEGTHRSGQLCYHIEYESYSRKLPPDIGRFHAEWRREPVTRTDAPPADRNRVQWAGKNLDGRGNYTILEAEGRGRLVGLLLAVDNLHDGWYGEGDDMIFVDGEPWPPRYHGTGTEEIFGGGATPNAEFAGPYSGFHLTERPDSRGKVAMFRWYLRDPVRFERSLRWTIEHGHANNWENDYTSVAYWYQTEPHRARLPLPPARDRLPRMPDVYLQARERLLALADQLPRFGAFPAADRERLRESRREAHRLFQTGKFDEVLAVLDAHAREVARLEKQR